MKKKVFALVMAMVMVWSLAACGGGSNNSGGNNNSSGGDSNTSGDEAQEIVVALITNTTGDYANYGLPVHNAAMMYFEEVNAAGGINGKQLKILEYDDKADGTESTNALNLAVQNGATAVLGSVLTGATIALADATYELNLPQITASATALNVTQIDPDDPNGEVRTNVFRACFTDPYQGELMADYAYNKMGARTAAILYESGSDYSEGLMNAFTAKAKEVGMEIVGSEAFATGDKDFKAQLTNIVNANPDVVYFPFYYAEAGVAVTQARTLGLKQTILGGDGFGGIKDYASAEDLEGTIYCSGYAPGTDSVKDFEAGYKAKYNEDVPNMFAPLAYDAAMILCKGLEAAEAKGLTPGSDEYKQTVIDTIAAMDGVAGITGSYSFDEYNNPEKPVAMIMLKDGAEIFDAMYEMK